MFDPTLPQENTPADAVQMRSQLNGLKDLIDTIPVGPPGQNGSDGTSVTGAVMDGTNTLNPGDAAQASVSWDGANVRFTFGIPRGQDGVSSPPITSFIVDGVNTLNPGDNATVQTNFDGASVRLLFGIPRGSDGTNGTNGGNGSDGGQGPPFTNFLVDGITTLNPGEAAMASASFDGSAVRLSFAIPRGNDGSSGMNGMNGSDGSQGPPGPPFANAVVDGVSTLSPWENATVQTSFDGSNVRFQFGIPRGNDGATGATGQPGEVSQTDLNNAQLNTLSQTSNNTNNVSTLGQTADSNYNPQQMQDVLNKMDELLNALRR